MPVKRTRDRYVLISPCRDEAVYAHRTLDSVAAQTLQPSRWIIVDDGSTDETPEILEEYSGRLQYLRVVRRRHQRERSVGPGVVEAFYAGLECVDLDEFDFVCKLDLDLELPAQYFEDLVKRMQENPRIGTCSGKPYSVNPRTGQLVSEKCGDETSVGMTKFYRVECFREIGGFVREVSWDGIDCHRCRMLGWIAISWDEPDLRFVHLRPMGSSHRGIWTGRVRAGFGQYFMGTSLVWMIATVCYRMTRPPLIIGGAGLLWGYLGGLLRRKPRYEDTDFRRYLRRYQRRCLFLGKREATRRTQTEAAASWHQRCSPDVDTNCPLEAV